MTPLLWLALATAAAWVIAAWRRPKAWPVAVALAVVVGVELVRETGLPVRLDLALGLAHPVVSAWCVWRVLT